MNYAMQTRPMAGNHRRKISARAITYLHEGKRLYSGLFNGKEALFIGRSERGVLCFELVTAA